LEHMRTRPSIQTSDTRIEKREWRQKNKYNLLPDTCCCCCCKEAQSQRGSPPRRQSMGEEMSRADRRGPRSQALFSAGSPSVATLFYYIWLAMFSQIAKLKIKVLKSSAFWDSQWP
jgi:hypothetical protein